MSRLYNILNSLTGRKYITEQGTTSGWEYRKWSDGSVEAWARNVGLGTHTGTVWASPIRYVDFTGAIPSGLFTSAPNLIVVSSGRQWWINSANATSSTAWSVRICTLASTAQAAAVNIYAYIGGGTA